MEQYPSPRSWWCIHWSMCCLAENSSLAKDMNPLKRRVKSDWYWDWKLFGRHISYKDVSWDSQEMILHLIISEYYNITGYRKDTQTTHETPNTRIHSLTVGLLSHVLKRNPQCYPSSINNMGATFLQVYDVCGLRMVRAWSLHWKNMEKQIR